MTGLTIRTALIGLGLLFLLTSGHTLAADSGEADRLIERLQARLAGDRDR
jgi:hypothetical protein